MDLTIAKKVLVEFQKKHEDYLRKAANYAAWKSLPFWKRWFTTRVEAPRKSYLYRVEPIKCTTSLTIELKMYFSGYNKEVSLAVNENGCGYKLNVNTKEKSYYLGRIKPVISRNTEILLENIRKELAPLYVE